MNGNPAAGKRFIIFISCLSLAALLVIIHYGILMLGPREADRRQTETASSGGKAGRGSILDRNGQILAIETRLGNVAVRKSRMQGPEDPENLSALLAPILDIPAADLLTRIHTSSFDYIFLKRQVPLSTIDYIESMRDEAAQTKKSMEGLIIDRAQGNIGVKKSKTQDLPGLCGILAPVLNISAGDLQDWIKASPGDEVYLKLQADWGIIEQIISTRDEADLRERSLRSLSLERVLGRIYPERNLAGQIIGFVGDENFGLAGIEYAFDTDLAPAEGANTGGSNGSTVVLTIDANVQYILEEIARQTMQENKAEAVMLMAMDPRTGDILGSASLPGFDPNNFKNSAELARMDRPAIWAYEPGSVFKVFSLAALMDAGAIGGSTIFTCNGRYERVTGRGERITINCLGAHGRVSARDIIIYSCNAGAAYAADRMGTDAFYSRLRDFGFGGRTGAGNPGETAGFLRGAERWSERSKPTIAMGQEIAVSALQMIQAASAVANDGVLVPPRIVARLESGEGKVLRTYEAGPARRVLRPETARAMRDYMKDVTSEIGTGWRANVEDLSLAVKTGTAQLIDAETGAYSSTDFIASCIALLPAESPSLILYLAIVKPQGASIYGGRIAAPPIREAAEALINYLGIPRGRNPQILHPGSISLPIPILPELKDRVPDFSGYAKRQLLPLLLREDISIEISGDGWVRRQSPPPGSPVNPGMTLRLELE